MVMNQSALLRQPTAMCNRDHQNVVLIRQQKAKKEKAGNVRKQIFNVFLLVPVYCEEEKQPAVGSTKKPTKKKNVAVIKRWYLVNSVTSIKPVNIHF